jgi:glycosyltransferase involved in cell wall biosynthesis
MYKIITIWHSSFKKNGKAFDPNPGITESYLNKYFLDRISIRNSLIKGGCTTVTFFENNLVVEKKETSFLANFPDVFRYIFEIFINLFFLIKYGKHGTILAIDPLSAIVPSILKKIGYVHRVYFLTPDFTKRRFENNILNKIYFFLDRISTNIADINICNSVEVINYKKQIYPNLNDSNFFHMPNIPPDWVVSRYRLNHKKNNKIVYVGNLSDDINLHGFKCLFNIIKDLKRDIPSISLVIVGDGSRKSSLVELAGNDESIKFLGLLDYELSLKEISESEIGLAFYNGDNSYDEFRDSLKIREYQSFGVIPITTDVVKSNCDEIRENNSGILVQEFDEDSLKESLKKILLNDSLKNNLRNNAYKNHEYYKDKYEILYTLMS